MMFLHCIVKPSQTCNHNQVLIVGNCREDSFSALVNNWLKRRLCKQKCWCEL